MLTDPKKIIFLIGPAWGKTTKATELVAHKKTVWLIGNDLGKVFCFEKVTPETQYIVFDECWEVNQHMKTLINSKKIIVYRRQQSSFEIERPALIIISNRIQKKQIGRLRWVQVIEYPNVPIPSFL